jgi:hypothetical protein
MFQLLAKVRTPLRLKGNRSESTELLLLPADAEPAVGLDGRRARPYTSFIEAIATVRP